MAPSYLKSFNKVFLWVGAGSILEYYDFVIYGMMAKYFSISFFPAQDNTAALLQAFLVFAVGYFARPFGGVLAGFIGDRFGRKPAFLMLTGLMAASTLAIGFLPDYASIGLLAPLLLVVCRFLQGLSFGAELPGATTILGEFSAPEHHGKFNGYLISSTTVGAIVATLVLYSLTVFLSESQIWAGGWRIPFLMGGIFGIILFFLRQGIQETPAFEQTPIKVQNPLKTLLLEHPLAIIKGILLTILFAALVVTNLYFPSYLPTYFGYAPKEVYFFTTISLIFCAVMMTITGTFSDNFSKREILLKSSLAYAVCVVPLFSLLFLRSNFVLMLFLLVHQLFITLLAPSYFSLMIKLFPIQIRYTGIAFCYNVTFALMALLPSCLTFLISYYSSLWVLPLVLSGLAFITFIGSYYFSYKEHPNPH